MTKSRDDLYSPERRTALVLSGVGTAGAYHAGVLRALHEAGVKLDVVAGRGVGAVGAVFAAVDGAQRLWADNGFWRARAIGTLYSWRPLVRLAAIAVAASVLLVLLPLAVMAAGLIVFPIDFVLKMIGVARGGGLVFRYLELANRLFAPAALPTWLPRVVLLVLGAAATIASASAWAGPPRGETRRTRGRFWWRLLRAPITATGAVEHCCAVLWDLVRGAAQLQQPDRTELGRRYTELLSDNLGQPGFRELLIVAHDVDTHGDLVFALVAESRRRALVRRPTTVETEERQAAIIDLAGVGRAHLTDAVAAALTVPLAAEFHSITFAAESYWRGETHRVCDRPASLLRLIEELVRLDVDQVILVSAAPDRPGPHQLDRVKLEGRGRIGDYLQSAEAAAVRDVTSLGGKGRPRIFAIQPLHNPIGPFDFRGGFDDRSDRRQSLGELMDRGYEDAYRQFIEPAVGASGERVGTA